ncbi:phosphoribosylaminoimidazole synthetase [Fictibacillus macauensis ZFHKF-1]|uniref:Phosphoribosylformylglycinamidine cyclo-ligase n=1 Tax=Fictibacillus macauensis ZFHKF-1 TaxID=1196324 RepID=I8AGS7_9BACL|nr:phosphoribosylformylglycinamidine cyclo-ligase [Fictibacillus macauensis]EIT84892.1 phosphoribosylaminoimidazole synthetase [Fictibacillus macauensis ZFHKF-1]
MAEAYKQAGVDIKAGYEAVHRMKKHALRTKRKEVLSGLGGFGAMFDLSQLAYKEPVLVSGTDGVGTKLMVAIEMDQHDSIGIDAVAMCVNDIVAQGAEPLYFLDYMACGKLEPAKAEAIVSGIADGCQQAGCALIGGETAEMPGMYKDDDYDVAGFAVGVAEKAKLLSPERVQEGDLLIGLASNGLHSNGYSLVRHILFEQNAYTLTMPFAQSGHTLGEELLRPTKIYVASLLHVFKQFTIHGAAHITGGGFEENIPRMLPDGLCAEVDYGSWPIPPIFDFIEESGNLSRKEMFTTFNMGIGMVLAVPHEEAIPVIAALEERGEKAYLLGRVKAGYEFSFGGGAL